MQPIFEFLGQFLGGPANAFIIVAALVKIALIIGGLMTAIPFVILFERKIMAWVQDRPGPNRVGPWGILQGFVDGGKLFLKEDLIPAGADKALFLLAPSMVVIPAFLAICLVPVGPIINGQDLQVLADFLRLSPAMLGPTGQVDSIPLAITNPNIGILYVLATTSLAVYGITLAGWSSNNKWSLLGGIRASAQMISYEITLSLAIIGVLLVSGSLNLYEIIHSQSGGFWSWNVIAQPLACMLFIIAMFAETNRLPFDLAEAEAELTGGFHTEYSSMKFALFFMGEYINMVVVSAVCITLFFGGYMGPIPFSTLGLNLNEGGLIANIIYYGIGPAIILPLKVAVFMFIYIFIRSVWPRLRYDKLMNMGWKWMLPLGLINLFITAIVVAISQAKFGEVTVPMKWVLFVLTGSLIFATDWLVSNRRRKQLKSEYKYVWYPEESKKKGLSSATT